MSKRSVFSTDLANDAEGQSWRAFGALELYVQHDKGNITDIIVLYRAPGGSILNITLGTDGKIEDIDKEPTLRLRKNDASADSQLPPPQWVTFDITVTSFNTEEAEFTGTLTQHDVSPPKTRLWRGFFLTYRDTPLSVIQQGQKPLPAHIKAFLDVSPLTNSGDNEVQSWADSLFLDLMIHGLPERPVNLLFHGNIGEVGSRFASEKIHGNIPPVLLTTTGNYVNPKAILADNNRLFYLAGIHLVVKSLRSADWFDKEFSNECQDKVEKFFKMVGCPEDASSATVNDLRNAYGSGLTAAQELDSLRPQYRDAIKRCFDAAYVCLRPNLATSLAQPGILNDIINVLRSPQYIEHWLPTLIQLSSTPGSIPIVGQLAMLFDKLELLAASEAKAQGRLVDLNVIHEVILLLSQAAQQTGLVRNSAINPSPEKAELKFDDIITEESIRNQAILNAMNYIESGGNSIDVYPGQVESMVVHHWLKDDIKPLGLYTWEFHLFSGCIVA